MMGKTTVGIVLMNSQSIVQNAMRMEISSAKTNDVYQSKFFHKNFLKFHNTYESLCWITSTLYGIVTKNFLGCKSEAIKILIS